MENLFIVKHFLSKNENFPNNNVLPLLIYKNAVVLKKSEDENASDLEKLFRKNDWKNSWRNGIYDYHHYHSTAHETMGIYNGTAKVQFGGPNGLITDLTIGDVLIIPAGVAHKCISSSDDFKCLGAYPRGQQYDMKYGEEEELDESELNIQTTPFPTHDPVFGKQGPMEKWWLPPKKNNLVIN